MKKIFAIILAICMLATMLCVPTFAAEEPEDKPAAGTVLRISAIDSDGDTVVVADHKNFVDGWNAAMELANDMEDYDYKRVIVDIYTDWNAVNMRFGSGDGFDDDAIYIPDDAKVTLDLNGHTINRGLTNVKSGEVMYIDEDADVIIKNGTITGGWSDSGAGGINIDEANVTLENVNIVGNKATDDDGGGIALYDGATLTMIGGSFENNQVRSGSIGCYGGAIYINDSTATFKGVKFKNNVTLGDNHYGAAIYADDSNVTINECVFDGNGIEDEANSFFAATSIVHAIDSSIAVIKTSFINNGDMHYEGNQQNGYRNVSTLFLLNDSSLVMEGGNNISENHTGHLIQSIYDSTFFISDTSFTNNKSTVFHSTNHTSDSSFNSCTFNNNGSNYISSKYSFASHTFITQSTITFYDCNMGNSTYSKNTLVKFINQESGSEIVLTLSALKADGTTVKLDDYRSFETGWNTAMALAVTDTYDRIVVDFHADWNTKKAPLASGHVVSIPENAKVIINLNGHTINRDKAGKTIDGEVMCVGEKANVIINDGTITGGDSHTGAGGIHIKDHARVVLNNVNVVKNEVNGSNGAAIAVYNGAILVMNGGSLSDNYLDYDYIPFFFEIPLYPYGTLYAYESTVTLNNVTISNNYTDDAESEGMAIYADNSNVTLNNCVVSGNGTAANGCSYAESIIGASNSTLIIKNSDFTGNGAVSSTDDIDYSHLFYLSAGRLTIEGGNIKNNAADKLFYFEDTLSKLNNVTITDNASLVLDVENDTDRKVTLTKCTLGNNSPVKYDVDIIVDTKGVLTMDACTLGDTVFDDKSMVTLYGNAVGSIFGEGSPAIIVSILALVASITSIGVSIALYKKKAAPAASDKAEEIKDKE